MGIIIAGGGTAALEAALTIRQYDKTSVIDIYSSENALPYRRTLLPNTLAGKFTWERLQYYPADFYSANSINLHLNTPIVKIDPASRQVTPNGKPAVPFGRLLIATGKNPRKIPQAAEFPDRIFSLHTYTDVLSIEEKLSNAQSAVIIGGGILGLECAAALLQRKLKVTLVEQHNTLLKGVLDCDSANFLQTELLKNYPALTIHTASSISKFADTSDRRLRCYIANSKQTPLETDFVIAAVGLTEENHWGFKLTTDKYLQVNNCKNIFAAGDCAAVCGQTTRFYKEARLQGKIAGANIAGQTTEYTFPVSECRTVIGCIPVYTAGITDTACSECLTEYHPNSIKKLFYRQDKLIGCILIGNIQSAGELYEIIKINHLLTR